MSKTDIHIANQMAAMMQSYMQKLCMDTAFPHALTERTQHELDPMYGNLDLLLGIEEIQELLVEIKKFSLDLPDKDIDHLTEKFTDCMIMTNFIADSQEIGKRDIFDMTRRLQEAFSDETGTLVSGMVTGCSFRTEAGLQRVEMVLSGVSKSFSKYMRGQISKETLTETITDMQIALYCIRSYFDVNVTEIQKWTAQKIEKTEKRNANNDGPNT